MKRPAVYIVANMINGTLYTGVTSDLPRRIWEHRNGFGDGFASRYGCRILVWFEMHETMEAAILEEKRIKPGSRQAKLRLIEATNPDWLDLFDSIAHG
jgi:putative endonuclease